MIRSRLALLFFFSGAVSLVYEVLWQRRFATVFGGSAPATAAVLVAFFAGLGCGSLVLGRAARRWSRPLRAYAVLEAGVGAGALLVAPILAAFDALPAGALPPIAVSWLAACAAVALPTFCMGGTLPVMARLVDAGEHHLGVHAGLLYAANTAGAALGALAVPFALLPAFGSTGAVRLAVAGNAVLALVAWGLDRRAAPLAAPAPAPSPAAARTAPSVLAWSCLSGLTAMALQVEWNRAFRQVHENSMYSFAVIVAVFIAALAVGAELARVALRRGVALARLFGIAWIGCGVAVAVGARLFLAWTDGLSYVRGAPQLAGLAAAVLFVPVVLAGIALPALMEEAGLARASNASDAVGRLLAANVVGSIAGALLAGFVLPGRVGLWGVVLVTAATLVVAGAVRLDPFRTKRARWALRAAAAVALAAGVVPLAAVSWPRVRVASGSGEHLVALSEGTHGIVAVVERPGSRRLKLDNSYVLGGTAATGDERMQTHLPLLLHPNPRRVAVLGVGTGITAGGALFHPVERLDAVELVPEVVAAARTYFGEANLGVLADGRTRVIVEDARRFLAGTPGAFDVVVGDLVVPWRRGESVLYTVEQFRAARRALAPGGVFCQWVPLFQLSERELAIVLRTFLAVFPRAWVWRGDFSPEESAIALVAGPDFELLPERVERGLARMTPDPSNPHLDDPIAVWMYLAGELERGDFEDEDGRVHGDDRPWLEILGPGDADAVTGRREQRWLSALAGRSAGRLGALGERERRGMEAGAVLSEFSLSLLERDEAGARAAQGRLRELLPQATFRAIFPE